MIFKNIMLCVVPLVFVLTASGGAGAQDSSVMTVKGLICHTGPQVDQFLQLARDGDVNLSAFSAISRINVSEGGFSCGIENAMFVVLQSPPAEPNNQLPYQVVHGTYRIMKIEVLAVENRLGWQVFMEPFEAYTYMELTSSSKK